MKPAGRVAAAVLAASALGAAGVTSPALAAGPSAELIVGVRSDAAATVNRLDADPGVRVLASTPPSALGAFTVTVPVAEQAGAIATLRSDPRVAYVEPNSIARIDAVTSADPIYPQQWGLTTARVPAAWDTTLGPGQVVAVVDTGVNRVSELTGRVLPGYDFVNKDSDPSDDFGHGTKVATVIAATGSDNAGMAGVCWKCLILPVKVMGSDGKGTYDNVAAGIIYAADHGADVINLSLGGPADSQALRDAVVYAASKDVLVVASAGNDGTTTRNYPAAIPQAVSVAGATRTDDRYSWSSYGSPADAWVDLAAPGYNAAQGPDGGYGWFEGTSSAAPMVAGIAALTRAANTQAAADQVRTTLENTADPVGNWVAKGRVDAAEAVTGIATVPSPKTPAPSTGPVSIGEIKVVPVSPARGALTVLPEVSSAAAEIRTVKMQVTMPSGKTAGLTSSKAPWSITWNSAGQTGTVGLQITAIDAKGNTAVASTSVEVDNTAPSAAVTLGSSVTGVTPVPLAAPADDLARMDLYVKNVLVASATGAPWEIPWDTTGLTGTVQLKVVTTDLAGNSSAANASVRIDNDGPKLAWKTPAVGPNSVLRGAITVSAQVTDASGVALVELLDGNGNVLGSDDTAPYAIPLDASGFDGPTRLTLRAADKLGLTSTIDKTIGFDNVAPEISMDLPTLTRGVVQIVPAVSDNGTIRSVKTILTLPTGRTVNMAATVAPWKLTWSSGTLTGTIGIATTVTDAAGNTTTASGSFEVDNKAPSVAFALPARAAAGVPVELTTPSDDTAKMELLIKGQLIAATESAPWSIPFDPAGVTGSIPLTVRVTDAAGNVSTLSKAVTIDTTGPVVRLMTTNKIMGTAAALRVSATDPAGVASVELLKDGVVVASSVKAPFAMTLDTTQFGKGTQTFQWRGTDAVGNVSTVDQVFTIS